MVNQAVNVMQPDTDAGDTTGKLSDASRSITDCCDEATQSTVRRQASFQTSSKHRRVDVASTQRYHHPAMQQRS